MQNAAKLRWWDFCTFCILRKQTARDVCQKGPQYEALIESTWVLEQQASPCDSSITVLPKYPKLFSHSSTVAQYLILSKYPSYWNVTQESVVARRMLSCSLMLFGLSYSWIDNTSNRDLNHFSCWERRYIYCWKQGRRSRSCTESQRGVIFIK